MEKELERYRKTIQLQTVLFAAAAVIVMALIALSLTQMIRPAYANERWASAWNGFICGVSLSAVGIMALGIVLNARALRSQPYLKKQYIREHDERSMEICHRSGHTSYWFDALGLLLGAIIGGYFNPVVALSCLGCLLYICLVRAAPKLYYHKKL
ncbi:MAG: hypothetical protein PHO66_08120 [Eubacteriales bacterium]|nr:hypothetical protein [Eubacteriales bacterium]